MLLMIEMLLEILSNGTNSRWTGGQSILVQRHSTANLLDQKIHITDNFEINVGINKLPLVLTMSFQSKMYFINNLDLTVCIFNSLWITVNQTDFKSIIL
jgi:hypothetical protein